MPPSGHRTSVRPPQLKPPTPRHSIQTRQGGTAVPQRISVHVDPVYRLAGPLLLRAVGRYPPRTGRGNFARTSRIALPFSYLRAALPDRRPAMVCTCTNSSVPGRKAGHAVQSHIAFALAERPVLANSLFFICCLLVVQSTALLRQACHVPQCDRPSRSGVIQADDVHLGTFAIESACLGNRDAQESKGLTEASSRLRKSANIPAKWKQYAVRPSQVEAQSNRREEIHQSRTGGKKLWRSSCATTWV